MGAGNKKKKWYSAAKNVSLFVMLKTMQYLISNIQDITHITLVNCKRKSFVSLMETKTEKHVLLPIATLPACTHDSLN
jgi:hypothetical protein